MRRQQKKQRKEVMRQGVTVKARVNLSLSELHSSASPCHSVSFSLKKKNSSCDSEWQDEFSFHLTWASQQLWFRRVFILWEVKKMFEHLQQRRAERRQEAESSSTLSLFLCPLKSIKVWCLSLFVWEDTVIICVPTGRKHHNRQMKTPGLHIQSLRSGKLVQNNKQDHNNWEMQHDYDRDTQTTKEVNYDRFGF